MQWHRPICHELFSQLEPDVSKFLRLRCINVPLTDCGEHAG